MKLGSHTYPHVKLSRAIDVARRIAADFKGRVSVASLATGLDMAERGGGFAALVASLRDYGLVDGRGDLVVTPLAESIIFEQDPQGCARAFYNVELFRKMAEKIGNDVPAEARLRAILREITGENLTTINSRLAEIKSVWLDGVQRCAGHGLNGPSRSPQAPEYTPGTTPQPQMASDTGDYAELRIADSYVRVRRDPAAIDLVVKLLGVLREELAAHMGAAVRALPPPSDDLSS